MRIHINGNLGYIGPVLVAHLRIKYPDSFLSGFDNAYFAGCLIDPISFPEKNLDAQYYGDMRSNHPPEMYDKVDAVVQLAAISNDPMGKEFEKATFDVNTEAVYHSAVLAKKSGVSHFIFASSCSVYGAGGDESRNEEAIVNPLTAYARSKVNAEERLKELADDNFIVTCLRFATACGWSPRIRFDLVLNDFVASAYIKKKIVVMSDGSPWRPLIHVNDMARAIEWAAKRRKEEGGTFLVVNTGSNNWNFQVRDLAYCVSNILGDVEVSINENALPDKRSYQVDFSKYTDLAMGYLPTYTLSSAVSEMFEELKKCNFLYQDFHLSPFIRLKVLSDLRQSGKLNTDLCWVDA